MRLTSLFLTLTMAAFFANAQDQPATPRKPDNTAVNKADRQQGQPTADQQKENASDRDMAKNVRRALVKDKTLSTYAHNVKVISENGMVTLKGPVRSEEEKTAVEAKAAEVAGANNVKSEITVAPKHESDRSSK
jgi:hyperosmotically inducible protein